MKDKSGKKITKKEFISRWKEGIANITPLQRLTNEAQSTLIMLVGFIMCLGAIIIYREKFIVNWFAYGLILIFIVNVWST